MRKTPLFCTCIAVLGLLFSTLALADVEYRLPSHIQPQFQQIHLNIDPDLLDYSGSTQIDLNISEASDKVGFYQRGLTVTDAALVSGDERIPLSLENADYDMTWGSAASPIQPGDYQLQLKFTGQLNTSSDGMYLSKFEERNYVFTQFEDMYARRAFPSFDEPSFKIPYQMVISAPEKHVVLSNTPVQSRQTADGWQKVVFEKTKPMPTYLIAYAVGELDAIEIEGMSVPGKIYTPKGQAQKAKFVAKHTAEILAALEEYFGIPYPYKKLDFVAVPNFTFGAMENAGLVTYRSELLLLEDEPSLTERRRPLEVVTHELAHQWYGNLVTMAWWDDLWLNEAFASWMATKIMVQLYPELNLQSGIVQEGAFPADARPTTKPVKKIVRRQPEVMDGLGLNYSKGESVLQMIEALVGEQAFQQGVRKYMQTHKWSNTEANDLWKVMASVSDIDVPAMMKTYLEQPGYPLVRFDKNGKVSQSRYRIGDAQVEEQVWTVPLQVLYKKQGKVDRTLVFLDDAETLVGKLAEAEWIFPNSNAIGYFRWQVPSDQLSALLQDRDQLNSREQKNLLYNSDALLQAGQLSLDEHMLVLSALAQSEDPSVARAVVASLGDLLYLVNDDNRQAFGDFLEAKLMPWFVQLGTAEKEGDSDDVLRLRTAVFNLLGQYSDDASVKAAATKIANSYLDDPQSQPRGLASAALSAMAEQGNAAWWDKYREAYMTTTDNNARNTLLGSMHFPQDENVKKTLNFALSDAVNPANTIRGLRVGAVAQDDKTLFYGWLNSNFEAVKNKLPSFHLSRMPEFLGAGCSTENVQLSTQFFEGIANEFDGMPRSLEVALQAAEQCVGLKQQHQKAFNQYLQSL